MRRVTVSGFSASTTGDPSCVPMGSSVYFLRLCQLTLFASTEQHQILLVSRQGGTPNDPSGILDEFTSFASARLVGSFVMQATKPMLSSS